MHGFHGKFTLRFVPLPSEMPLGGRIFPLLHLLGLQRLPVFNVVPRDVVFLVVLGPVATPSRRGGGGGCRRRRWLGGRRSRDGLLQFRDALFQRLGGGSHADGQTMRVIGGRHLDLVNLRLRYIYTHTAAIVDDDFVDGP